MSKNEPPHETLRKSKPEIARLVSRWTREKIPPAENLAHSVLEDSLDHYLDEIVDVLQGKTEIDRFTYSSFIGRQHGLERAEMTEFSLENILQEYSIIKEAIFQVVSAQTDIPPKDRQTIQDLVDYASWASARQFLEKRHLAAESKMASDLSGMTQKADMLERFAIQAAHDLKSPLATIHAALELLHYEIGEKLNTTAASVMEISLDNTRHLLALIDGILKFAQNTMLPIERARIDMNEIMKIVLSTNRELLSKENAEVEYDPLPVVAGDPHLLTELVQNIILNAVNHRGEKTPVIRVSATEEAPFWRIAIEDNGPGFAPEDAGSLFEPFTKGRITSRHLGMGLGLATCKRIVESHGGTIKAESTPGRGATFSFTLMGADR